MNNGVYIIFFWIWISVNILKSDDEIVVKCSKDMDHEIFEEPTRSSSCTPKEIAQLPAVLKPKTKTETPNPLDFLSYVFFPSGLDNFIQTERKSQKESRKHQTSLIDENSVRFRIGTRDNGKTLMIFFPGTQNLADVAIDISVKHTTVKLPDIVDEKFKHKDPKDLKSKKLSHKELEKLKIYDFRVHDGIHSKLMHNGIQRGIQEKLLYLYSGQEVMESISWTRFVKVQKIKKPLEKLLIKHGFRDENKMGKHRFVDKVDMTTDAGWTNAEAMDLKSTEWGNFIKDSNVTKQDIIDLTNAIKNTKKRRVKNQRNGILTTKVEYLILSGHSLGAGYATYFFLRLYGDGYLRNAPGFHVLPDIDHVFVIPIAAPNILYFEDVQKIDPKVLCRITNIWNYFDPVPIILNGMKKETKENVGLGLKSLMTHTSDKKLIELGTNQPIGNIIILITGKKRVKDETEIKGWKQELNEEVWLKIIPYQDALPYSSNVKFYTKNGAKCLWKRSKLFFGAAKGFVAHHRLSTYRKALSKSCLKDYLNANSEYWKTFVMEHLAEEAEEVQGFKFKDLWSRFSTKGKKKTKSSGAKTLSNDNLMDLNSNGQNIEHSMFYEYGIVAVLLVILVCSFGFGLIFGYLVACIDKC